jgi:ribosomal protein S18 acetylase RimI-like enzyme
MFELKVASKNDEAAIVNLGNSIFGPNYMEQLFRMNLNLEKSSIIFFDKKVVGYILLLFQNNSNYICSFGVEEKWRRHRIGTVLLRATIKLVKTDIFLHVKIDSAAIKLYKKNGFRIERVEPFYYGRTSAYRMVLKYNQERKPLNARTKKQ